MPRSDEALPKERKPSSLTRGQAASVILALVIVIPWLGYILVVLMLTPSGYPESVRWILSWSFLRYLTGAAIVAFSVQLFPALVAALYACACFGVTAGSRPWGC